MSLTIGQGYPLGGILKKLYYTIDRENVKGMKIRGNLTNMLVYGLIFPIYIMSWERDKRLFHSIMTFFVDLVKF